MTINQWNSDNQATGYRARGVVVIAKTFSFFSREDHPADMEMLDRLVSNENDRISKENQ